MERKPQLDARTLDRLLTQIHHRAPHDIEPIAGGFWSSAYGYLVEGEHFVLRLGFSDEGYQIDRQAASYARPGLPIPEVIDIGSVDQLKYAVSRRHVGDFIETRPVDHADAVGESMVDLLHAMLSVEPNPTVEWYDPRASVPSWADWLRRSVEPPIDADWRQSLDRASSAVFDACLERINETLVACPERRDWVHGDLLHQNVLVGEGSRGVTGVFSWKCSARGDFLYDVAWCTFWSAWHPVIEAARIWERMWQSDAVEEPGWLDAGIRHHCYELQIAASHFGWYVKTEDRENLEKAVQRAARILDRGPLAVDRASPVGETSA